MALRAGVGKELLKDPKDLVSSVRETLPAHAAFIDEYGVNALYFLVDDLKERVLSEVVASLEAADSDRKSIEQAATIQKEVDRAIAALSMPAVEVPAGIGR